MGWGIEFQTDIFLRSMSFVSKQELEDKIKDLEENITDYKKSIYMYASCNIKDIVPNDFNDQPIRWLKSELDEGFQSFEEDFKLLQNLYLYKQYLEDGNDLVKSN